MARPEPKPTSQEQNAGTLAGDELVRVSRQVSLGAWSSYSATLADVARLAENYLGDFQVAPTSGLPIKKMSDWLEDLFNSTGGLDDLQDIVDGLQITVDGLLAAQTGGGAYGALTLPDLNSYSGVTEGSIGNVWTTGDAGSYWYHSGAWLYAGPNVAQLDLRVKALEEMNTVTRVEVPGFDLEITSVVRDFNNRVIRMEVVEDDAPVTYKATSTGLKAMADTIVVPRVEVPGFDDIASVTIGSNNRVSRLAKSDAVEFVSTEGGLRTFGDPQSFDYFIYEANLSGLMAAKRAYNQGCRSICVMSPGGQVGGVLTGGLTWIDYPTQGGNTSTGGTRSSALLGGLTRRFFLDASGKYTPGTNNLQQGFEAKVLRDMFLKEFAALGCTMIFNGRISKQAGQVLIAYTPSNRPYIQGIRTPIGFIRAKQYCDASYEMDLAAAAGVPYSVGRESLSTYNEQRSGAIYAGYKPASMTTFNLLRSGAVDNAGTRRLQPPPTGVAGDGDNRIMAYNFRTLLTNYEPLVVPFTKPDNYNRDEYYLSMQNAVLSGTPTFLQMTGDHGMVPILGVASTTDNRKIPTNSTAIMSIDMPGSNYEYPEGSWALRDKIAADHAYRIAGWFYYLQNDILQHTIDLGLGEPYLSNAASIQADAQNYGYCLDEWEDSPYIKHFPNQLYIREARRMIGKKVMTLFDMNSPVTKPSSLPGDPPTWPTSTNTQPHPICMWNYPRDTHGVRYFLQSDLVLRGEGGFPSSVYNYTDDYQFPAEAIMPDDSGPINLTVPVCHSASNVFYSSSRMEPLFGMAGEAAGELAMWAIQNNAAIQDFDYATIQARLKAGGSILV